jgi:hypothetical protein
MRAAQPLSGERIRHLIFFAPNLSFTLYPSKSALPVCSHVHRKSHLRCDKTLPHLRHASGMTYAQRLLTF